MVLNAALIILLGLLCFMGVIVCVVFTILGIANNRPGKYIWLTGFLICLIGMVLCIFLFVNRAVNKVQHFTETLNERMENSLQNYADSVSNDAQRQLESNTHIRLLKSYYPDSTAVPAQFYYYLGFESYYRYPLRYPYSIHCSVFRENGELFNEAQVQYFDENDNGEIHTGIDQIDRIALDRQYLLIDRKVKSTRAPEPIHHYVLYQFDSGKSEEVPTEKELFILAKQKGYRGPGTLMSINEYHELFQSHDHAFEAQ